MDPVRSCKQTKSKRRQRILSLKCLPHLTASEDTPVPVSHFLVCVYGSIVSWGTVGGNRGKKSKRVSRLGRKKSHCRRVQECQPMRVRDPEDMVRGDLLEIQGEVGRFLLLWTESMHILGISGGAGRMVSPFVTDK